MLGGRDRGPDDLRDHADRLLRHDGHGHRRRRQAGLADEDGRCRTSAGSCSSTASPRSPAAPAASRSNTTYIESAAGVAEGGRTGFASVVTGVLFLVADLPGAAGAAHPVRGDGAGAGARRLPDVHARSRTSTSRDVEEGLPALLDDDPDAADLQTSPSASAPAFISWVFIKVVRGKIERDPPADVGRRDRLRRLLPAGLDHRDPARRRQRCRHPRRRPGPPAGAPRSFLYHRPRCSNGPRCPSGPRVISARLPGARSVSIAAYVLAGSRLESDASRPASPTSWSTSPSRARRPTRRRARSARRSRASAARSTPRRTASRPSTGCACRGARRSGPSTSWAS